MAQDSPAKKFKLEDIYFVLFRRKWTLLALCLVGLFAAAASYKNSEKPYSSQAELLVRFVMDSNVGAALLPGSEDQIRSASSFGASILNNETEILTSLDLAKEVARQVGSEQILGAKVPGPKGDESAARVIVGGLQVGVVGRASILNVIFSHPDPNVTQMVLEELLRSYLKRHAEIHLKGADYELLARQTEELRLRLERTEQEVNRVRGQVGGVSLDQSKDALAKEIAAIRSAILETEMELAATNPAMSADSYASEPLTQAALAPTNTEPLMGYDAAALQLSSSALMERAKSLREREQDYLSRFTEDNPLVKSVRSQIAEVDLQLSLLAKTNPDIVLGTLGVDPSIALRARLNLLTNRFQAALVEATRLNDLENSLTELLRRKEIQEQNYKHLATSLERERFDAALEFSKLSNIVVNQEPSPPVKNAKDAQKLALMILAGVIGGGFGLVFLFEFFLDPRLKRASQIEKDLSLPLYMSIPRIRGNGFKALQQPLSAERQLRAGMDTPAEVSGGNGGGSARGGMSELGELRSYFEALRDRIVVYFERVNLRRKPKLVGLAGCHSEAGVSTVARGLAETLSETGGGKVLLVNLNAGSEGVSSFLQGRPAVHLKDVLEQASEEDKGTSEALLLASLSQPHGDYHPVRSREFDQLIPRLKASDFDYIVFDMPPLHATSVSYRLSGFLDKMLIVAECEKTQLESLKRAAAMLEESNARIATVLNKRQEYLPGWLRQSI